MASLDSVLGGPVGSIAFLKVLADNSFDSVLVTDATAQGNILYANKAFRKLTGHDPGKWVSLKSWAQCAR
jgi:PAS domain-containing protein